ncbi:PEPxxWA-CTERM sorting domain-containing protein [Sphingomonas sp.]|uniref:PEPxxWA-CTERM sorting domain-containing protein n=1 Tax=Sphingomonas sp. TaxID=28214 RepID=UPI0038A3D722
MRKLVLATAAAAAMASASGANAAITLGSTGQLSGSSTSVTSAITDNVNNPNAMTFTTNNAAAGVGTSFFDFLESYASTGVFSVTTSTFPSSSVTLFNVLTGQPVYASTVATQAGSGYSLNLTTSLAANTWYRFTYTANMATPGNLAGTANFYVATVPEPATWALMLLGFGGMGFALRRRRRPVLAQLA